MSDKHWKDKANAIITQMAAQSWRQANITASGKKRKRHVPYSIPDTAQQLVKALGRNDEETAKSIMMYDYDAQQAWAEVRRAKHTRVAHTR